MKVVTVWDRGTVMESHNWRERITVAGQHVDSVNYWGHNHLVRSFDVVPCHPKPVICHRWIPTVYRIVKLGVTAIWLRVFKILSAGTSLILLFTWLAFIWRFFVGNVVFPSDLLAGTALKDLTSPLRVTKRPLPVQVGIPGAIQQPVCDGDTGEAIFISDVISFPIPVPQGTWRVAKAHPSNTKQMIFRYARTIDKKPQNAQKFSQYYNKYGNPNLSGLPKQDVENRRERCVLSFEFITD